MNKWKKSHFIRLGPFIVGKWNLENSDSPKLSQDYIQSRYATTQQAFIHFHFVTSKTAEKFNS